MGTRTPLLCSVLLLRGPVSVRLKGRHRHGSAPMFIRQGHVSRFAESLILVNRRCFFAYPNCCSGKTKFPCPKGVARQDYKIILELYACLVTAYFAHLAAEKLNFMVVQWGIFAPESPVKFAADVPVVKVVHPYAQLTSFGLTKENIVVLNVSYNGVFSWMGFESDNASTVFFVIDPTYLPQCQPPGSAEYEARVASLPQCQKPGSAEYRDGKASLLASLPQCKEPGSAEYEDWTASLP